MKADLPDDYLANQKFSSYMESIIRLDRNCCDSWWDRKLRNHFPKRLSHWWPLFGIYHWWKFKAPEYKACVSLWGKHLCGESLCEWREQPGIQNQEVLTSAEVVATLLLLLLFIDHGYKTETIFFSEPLFKCVLKTSLPSSYIKAPAFKITWRAIIKLYGSFLIKHQSIKFFTRLIQRPFLPNKKLRPT